ncbi:hypothetical protein DPMN_138228 [Dreissena polymorpha]|uniref:Uncharacterized protein n=1 Tax=Dreissena polymorpha TaxID=45954 RepID=A0A9D4G6X6_DREPO|nr:hypothetical protein DPMN_138228 [Dreissena polymorpha]
MESEIVQSRNSASEQSCRLIIVATNVGDEGAKSKRRIYRTIGCERSSSIF